MGPSDFVNELARLVDEEEKCDNDEVLQNRSRYSPQELQRRGVALVNLQASSIRTGLGGQSLVDFEAPSDRSGILPTHRLKVGDIVAIEEYVAKAKSTPRGKSGGTNGSQSTNFDRADSGVVYRITTDKIVVVFKDDLPDVLQNDASRVSMFKLANSITYTRMRYALKDVNRAIGETSSGEPSDSLLRVLFGLQTPSFDMDLSKNVEFFDKGLNDAQKEAVKLALASKELFLVHGPPGTGKTYTCVEIVRQLAKHGKRVLVCGPSNISVDNLVERLSKCKLDIVRVGHPARILDTVLSQSLEARVRSSDEGQIVNDVRNDMDKALASIQKSKSRAEKREHYVNMKELRKEFRQREVKVVDGILRNANVVLTTLNGSGSKKLMKENFDVVLIDEATQALEPECWIAMLKAKRVILAGDHLQLPPTVKSKPKKIKEIKGSKAKKAEARKGSDTSEASKADDSPKPGVVELPSTLESTLFDRMLKQHGNKIRKMLNIQYRMNEMIMKFSSKEFYEGKLTAHSSVKDHLLSDADKIKSTDETSVPVVFIDTAGCEMRERSEEDDAPAGDDSAQSKYNEGEAELVVQYVEKLTSAGVNPSDIGIISPYNAQVTRLRNTLKEKYPQLEIDTVDGFQGREKEAIIVTLVRSNDKGEIGFLSEHRRLNVAITRPRRHLSLIGDSETLSGKDKFFGRLCEYLSDECELRFPN
ncbi:DNA helicase [Cladochytrium replicatum]|nr:DNA helicase [Cladochytrium replicatum]